MHIETRAVGKRKKYYLAHSFRHENKVKKMRYYLGANLSEKELAEKREQGERVLEERIRAYRAIRDPFRTVLSPAEMKELESLEARGDVKVFHLSEDDWKRFTRIFTYDTNAIEGSTVSLAEVEEILEKDEWPENRTKYEISETYGVAEAVERIRRTKEHVSLGLIKGLHRIVFKNSKPFAGKFRRLGVEVAVVDAAGNVVHRGSPASQIEELLEELVAWYRLNKKKYSPIVLAAVVHNQFENIHPFQDGNGRVGRLLLNNVLIKHGFPPVNIEFSKRAEYYRALQAYQKEGNLRPMIELIIQEYRSLKRQIKR